MTKQEFAKTIKQKYPDYQGVDDNTLVDKILIKYPVYKSQITDLQQTPTGPQGVGGLAGFGVGAAKGVASTATGASSLGERALGSLWKTVLPKSLEKSLGFENAPTLGILKKNNIQTQTSAESVIPKEYRTPVGGAEKAGFITEQIAEFLLPSSKIAKAEKGLPLLQKAATESLIAGGQTAIQKGKIDNDTKTASIVGAIFPIAGAGLSKAKGIFKPIGEKIQTSVLKPTARDLADGFKIENVNKYNLGGSIQKTVTKVQTNLNELSDKLKLALRNKQNVAVNLNNTYAETVNELLKTSKSKQFGDIGATKRVLETLKSEIEEVAGKNGLVDLVEANEIKRGAGTKGAWAFGRAEPDSSAVEKVYTTFYGKIKNAIEKSSPEDIRGINKQISDLIPISNAALRRLPVDARNNIISLTDSMGLFGAMFDPKALTLMGANRLSKSGSFGAFLAKLGTKKQPYTAVGERIFGGNIDDLKNLPVGMSIEDVTKKTGFNPLAVGKTASKVDDTLLQEARKYKSAEEFVKAQGDILYHGTPAKFETKDFKGGYLTADKNYADIYKSRSASSISYGSEGVKNKASGIPRTLEFVIKKDANLFDYTNPKHRALLKDYFGKSSMSSEPAIG